MNSFKDYKEIIESALGNNVSKKLITELHLKIHNLKTSISKDLVDVATVMKAKQIEEKEQVVGHHPDFKDLKDRKTKKCNIVSVFIDVEGSTNLFKKYDNETVFDITNTIQLAAIDVCKLFGGFIHRLQGDGLFVYFGGEKVDKSLANIHALTALSFFNYFLENDLKKLFKDQDIEEINAKVGIDFGKDNKDVLWAMAGTGGSSEITTTSLHTSLASKMQQFAGSNGIVIGQNVVNVVKDFIDLTKVGYDLLEVVEERKYIFEDEKKAYYYKQHKFKWCEFLNAIFDNVNPNDSGVRLQKDSEPLLEKITAAYKEQIKKNKKAESELLLKAELDGQHKLMGLQPK